VELERILAGHVPDEKFEDLLEEPVDIAKKT